MSLDPNALGNIVTAVGALGVAACALVDTSKALPGGGISNAGFESIKAAVRLYLPEQTAIAATQVNAPADQTTPGSLLHTLHSNWINGMALTDQKAIAKSLVKLQLGPATAKDFAAATQVDAVALTEVAVRITTGQPLDSAQQTNALGRFDLALTATLDAAYQRAEQRYRNASKTWAGICAIVLAGVGGATIADVPSAYLGSSLMWMSLFCGLLAVPLAPITKDLTSALSAGVKLAQSLKR